MSVSGTGVLLGFLINVTAELRIVQGLIPNQVSNKCTKCAKALAMLLCLTHSYQHLTHTLVYHYFMSVSLLC